MTVKKTPSIHRTPSDSFLFYPFTSYYFVRKDYTRYGKIPDIVLT